MRKSDIEQISEAYQSGTLSELDYYEQEALSQVAEMSEFKIEGIVTIAAAFLGFSFMGTIGGIGAVIIGIAMVWDKLKAGDKAAADIDSGNIAAYLPEAERPYYERAKQKAIEAKTITVSAATPLAPTQPANTEPESLAATPVSNQLTNAQSSDTQPTDTEPERTTLDTEPDCATLNIAELRHYPALIIFGAQGSGKSSLAKAIAYDRMTHDHKIGILDPHGGDWGVFHVVGGGMAYAQIEEAIKKFLAEVEARYKCFATGNRQFEKATVICDEFTNWSARLDAETAVEFLKTSWTDTRKIDLHTIFIAHTNTLEGGLSGVKGLSTLRDNGCYQIELFSKAGAEGKATPTGEGKLYRPGQAPVTVKIPFQHFEKGEPIATDSNQNFERITSEQLSDVNRVNDLNQAQEIMPVQSVQSLNPSELDVEPQAEPSVNGSEPTLNDETMSAEQALNTHVNQLSERDRAHLLYARGLKRDDIIFRIWNVKKGGSERYKQGKEHLKLWLGI